MSLQHQLRLRPEFKFARVIKVLSGTDRERTPTTRRAFAIIG
jgi:hypothetical protein